MEAEVTVAKSKFRFIPLCHNLSLTWAPNLKYLCFKSNDQVDIFISLYSELFTTSELILHSLM